MKRIQAHADLSCIVNRVLTLESRGDLIEIGSCLFEADVAPQARHHPQEVCATILAARIVIERERNRDLGLPERKHEVPRQYSDNRVGEAVERDRSCLLYTSPSPR